MKDGDHELCDGCHKCLTCETCTCAAGHGARLALLEKALCEIVEAFGVWDMTSAEDCASAWSHVEATISAARDLLAKGSGK